MAATSTVGQASGHSHTSTATTMKYRTTNSGTPLAHLDVDNNFELLRQAVNGIIGDIDGVVDKDLTSDLSNASLGYTESGNNYPVEKASNKLYVNVPWTDTTYSTATSNDLGLVKIGYTESGNNYPVELSNDQMYVNVPWSDTTYSVATSSTPGLVKSGGDITVAADGTVTVNGGTGGGGASVTTDVTAPSNPSDGDLWFNENEAELYVYTASLGAWIQTNGGGGSGGGETYESAETAIPVTNTTQEWTHGLGQTPTHISLSLRCKTAEYGYDVGDEITFSSEYTYGIASYTFWANSTKIGFRSYIAAGPTPFTIVKRDVVNAVVNPTANNWKVVVRASVGVGGGGSGNAGLPRTQWPVRAVDGINTLNSFDFSVTGNQWKYSPQKRYNFVYPNSWVFNAVRGLNPSSAVNFAFSRDGDFVKFYHGANNAGSGCAALIVSNSGSYNKGGYIIGQTNESGYLQVSCSNGPHTGYGADGNLMGIVSPTIVNNVVYNTSTTTSWATASTGYANSLVMLLMEPHQGGGGGNTFVKRKGDSNIINSSVSGNYAGKGCAALTVSGNNASGGTPFWRGGYCFCMTDANGDLEVSSAVNSNLKMTVIGYVPSATTSTVIHNNANIVVNPTNVTGSGSGEDGDYGTTISTGLSGYNLVLLKVIGSGGNSMLFKTPGDSFTGYAGTSYAGWGASGVYVNNGNGGYVVAMTDGNGDIKAMSSTAGNATVTRVGSVPITLA